MLLNFDNFIPYIIVALCAIIYLKYKKPSKSKRSHSYISNSSVRIAEINKCIQKFNSILTRFDILATQVNRVCNKHQDAMSLKQLENLTDEFMKLYPQCSCFINEIKDIDDNDNTFEYLIFKIKQLLADMDIVLDKINKLEHNSKDYTSTDYKFNKEDNPTYSSIYFAGCNNIDSLNKRYHILAKAYHPDNNFGDKLTFQKMSDEYENLKKQY